MLGRQFFPTQKPEKPLIDDVVYDKTLSKFMIYRGATFNWVYIDELVPHLDCTLCKVSILEHQGQGHPFFKDNLEYLEWAYEQTV